MDNDDDGFNTVGFVGVHPSHCWSLLTIVDNGCELGWLVGTTMAMDKPAIILHELQDGGQSCFDDGVK